MGIIGHPAKQSCHGFCHATAGKTQTCLNVRFFQVRHFLKDFLGGKSVGKQIQHITDPDTHSPHTRPTTALVRMMGYPLE